jgi:alkanesulfonate monooxygenase SsuD/methylene tetrahydromethanopterin reductase-like flavin-dependent oxidoreductase (luciferase family)
MSEQPTSTQSPRFGLFVHQLGKSLAQIYKAFELADELGFDCAWLSDHVVTPGASFLESWTLLAAVAERTKRVRLGVLVTNNAFRHPLVLLKEAVTVDHISGGRLILGVGTGYPPDEPARYGIDFPAAGERVDRLEEAVTLMRLMMSQDRTTFEGRYYRVVDASLEPSAVQKPRIPILIAAHRPRMIRIAARHADQWDSFHEMEDTPTAGLKMPIAHQMAILDDECRAIGRNPAEIRRSTWATRGALASVDAFRDFASRHLALGFTDVSVVLPEPVDVAVLTAVARDVLPDLRNAQLH